VELRVEQSAPAVVYSCAHPFFIKGPDIAESLDRKRCSGKCAPRWPFSGWAILNISAQDIAAVLAVNKPDSPVKSGTYLRVVSTCGGKARILMKKFKYAMMETDDIWVAPGIEMDFLARQWWYQSRDSIHCLGAIHKMQHKPYESNRFVTVKRQHRQ